MDLPSNLQATLSKYREMVRSADNHQLSFEGRLILYREFGLHQTDDVLDKTTGNWHLVLTPAACVLGWLAILTARKVLPFWDPSNLPLEARNDIYSCGPYEMLEVAEKALLRKITADEAKDDLLGKFYYGLSGKEHFLTDRALNANGAANGAAYDALETVVYGLESFEKVSDDFASYAMKAAALLNSPRKDSTLNPEFFGLEVDVVFNADFKGSLFLKEPEIYSSEKALDFWEWWLSEAIPRAWELAGQNNPVA